MRTTFLPKKTKQLFSNPHSYLCFCTSVLSLSSDCTTPPFSEKKTAIIRNRTRLINKIRKKQTPGVPLSISVCQTKTMTRFGISLNSTKISEPIEEMSSSVNSDSVGPGSSCASVTSARRRRKNTKTLRLMDALQKDQDIRCSGMGSVDSGPFHRSASFARSSESSLSADSSLSMGRFGALPEDFEDGSIILPPRCQRGDLSDSDQLFLEGLLVFAPDRVDALQDLMNPRAIPFVVFDKPAF